MIGTPFQLRAVGRLRAPARPLGPRPQRVDLRPGERAPRPAGNLEEGEPHGLPGTYLNGFYETRPLPYPEGGYGYPEAGQAMVNVTNGKIIRLLVDDEPFDVRYGELQHERTLDFRASPAAMPNGSRRRDRVRVTSERLVSLEHRSVAAILYEVEPLEAAARFVVQSELVTNEPLPGAVEKDRGRAPASALRSSRSSSTIARSGSCWPIAPPRAG